VTGRSAVTTHVLDTARGVPAAGVPVRLERVTQAGAEPLAAGLTDADGRIGDLGPAQLPEGTYRLVFITGAYLAAQAGGTPPFFPEVAVTFAVTGRVGHCHVPLLLSPFGYATYLGS
jgi:5-hydroxyisourate hydrolase